MIKRPHYLNWLHRWKNKDVIKVITGMRRSGKSTIMQLFQEDLMQSGVPSQNIISINFESLEESYPLTAQELYNYVVARLAPDGVTYVFLDEIQQVKEFEKAASGLFVRDDIDLYLTGSNAHFLSSEIATDNEDYVFDTTVYTITDTVRNEDGQLVVDRVVTNDDNRQVTSMTFINFFVGDDVEVQQVVPGTPGTTAPGGGGSSGTASSQPVPGPKTGDYADPLAMVLGMAISALVVFFTLVLILMDRRSEKEHGQTAVSVAT
ncbi:MAG: AAA family ATPase [Coriobacteriia bacterium]|nr:AAA family ATPase [Coriobacteriia bacterium]